MRTEQQIIKAEKLSPTMVEAITYRADSDGWTGTGIIMCGTKTELALIARGLMHPVQSHLTDKGLSIVKEILAARQAKREQNITDAADILSEIKFDGDPAVETDPVEVAPVVVEAKPAAKPPLTVVGQTIKDEKLTNAMVYAIRTISPHSGAEASVGTIVALIDRGILTPQAAHTKGQHLLTDKGVTLFRFFAEREPHPETTEAYVTANTVVYEEGDRVTSKLRPDLGTGTVRQVRLGSHGQVVVVAWESNPSVAYPANHRSLSKVEEPYMIGGQCTDCGNGPTGHSWTCTNRANPRFTASMVERDESAEFVARHPEREGDQMAYVPLGAEIATTRGHQTDRDRLARSIAYEFSHRFLTWGINDPQPEQPIVPRDLDRMRMFQFYQDGSIYDPGQLLAEIRNEMTDQAMAFADAQVTTGSVMTSRMDAVNAMLWLGWLNGYILECGAVDSDGWQDRVRGPQDGWEGLGLYSTEPSDATELPAWADPEDNESFGCVAVISPQGRYSDAENCGDGITREEYHAHGSEFGMCEQHRLAKIAADDKGW